MSAKEAARGGRRGKNLHRGICISGPFCARVGEMTLPCPAGARRRCKCAYSTLFAPAGRRRFRVGAPDFGVSRRKGVCGAVCPSRAVWQARREAENGAAIPPFAACSREKREGRCGFRASSANRSSRAALSPCHPAGRTAGSARTRSRVQTLENPFLGERRPSFRLSGPIRSETQNAHPMLVGWAFAYTGQRHWPSTRT